MIGMDFHRSENGCEKVPENQSEKNKDTDDYLRAIFLHDGDKLETHFISPLGTDSYEARQGYSTVTDLARFLG